MFQKQQGPQRSRKSKDPVFPNGAEPRHSQRREATLLPKRRKELYQRAAGLGLVKGAEAPACPKGRKHQRFQGEKSPGVPEGAEAQA